jgi:hypothetical protein
MGIFGGSYPPGCNSVPGDEPSICEVCGKDTDSCECPECPTCGKQGNPVCYEEHGLVRSERPDDLPDEPEGGVDFDEATYIGDEKDGVYYQVTQAKDGWYVSATVDSDTGSFVDTIVDRDGPYATETEARMVGEDAAKEWCFHNEVEWLSRVRVEIKAGAKMGQIEECLGVPNVCDTDWEQEPEDEGGGACVAILWFDDADAAFLAAKSINFKFKEIASARMVYDEDHIVEPGEEGDDEG